MRVHHAKGALLLDLLDQAWVNSVLPDDDVLLPPEMHIDPETEEHKIPIAEELWTDLALDEFNA